MPTKARQTCQSPATFIEPGTNEGTHEYVTASLAQWSIASSLGNAEIQSHPSLVFRHPCPHHLSCEAFQVRAQSAGLLSMMSFSSVDLELSILYVKFYSHINTTISFSRAPYSPAVMMSWSYFDAFPYSVQVGLLNLTMNRDPW